MSIASIQPVGDSSAIVTWPAATDEVIPDLIRQLATSLQPESRLTGIVPGFASLTLHYDPVQLIWPEVHELIAQGIRSMAVQAVQHRPVIEIPVCYAAEYALDLRELATHHGLTVNEVIRLHSGVTYTVRMIGFSPGFPYLAGLPEQLATPRRSSPRLSVPAGSVAIGGRQAGIYSLESPGGWQIIGRTPVRLFQPERDPPSLLQAGDRVRFVSIARRDFPDQQEPV